jgi:hypothetical protein
MYFKKLQFKFPVLENRTRIESPIMSEISDEEVDYGSFESSVNLSTDSDHPWSTSENDS